PDLALRSRRSPPLVALHRADHAFAIGRNAGVAHIGRPRIDSLRDGIDVDRVPGTERDRLASMDVLRGIIAIWVGPAPARGGWDRDECERANDLAHGYLPRAGPAGPGSMGMIWP